MKKNFPAIALATLISTSAFVSTSAFAASGAMTAGASMYAGPGSRYPEVIHLARGLSVTIHGCLRTWQWCDVSWRGDRGWVPAEALQYREGDRSLPVDALRGDTARSNTVQASLPVIAFDIQNYWDANYRERLWYDDRAKWEGGAARSRPD